MWINISKKGVMLYNARIVISCILYLTITICMLEVLLAAIIGNGAGSVTFAILFILCVAYFVVMLFSSITKVVNAISVGITELSIIVTFAHISGFSRTYSYDREDVNVSVRDNKYIAFSGKCLRIIRFKDNDERLKISQNRLIRIPDMLDSSNSKLDIFRQIYEK